MSTFPPRKARPHATTGIDTRKSLNVIFMWTFIIFGALGWLNQVQAGYPVIGLVDGVISGLLWGGGICGCVALYRMVRKTTVNS